MSDDWNEHKLYINNTLKTLNEIVDKLNTKVTQLEVRVLTVCSVASVLGSAVVTFIVRTLS